MSPTRTALSANCSFAVQRTKSKSLFEAINDYRRSRSLPPLTWDDNLYTYCVLHNVDMHGSKVKSSEFKMGQAYNENTGHSQSSSRSEILDLWRTKEQEKGNLLFDGVKYSAVAILGDDNECYATQICTAERPKKNDKVPSMKTNKPCTSCGPTSILSRAKSSFSPKATTAASTRLQSKSAKSVARTGVSAGKTTSLFGLSNQQSAPITQTFKNIGQSVISGFKTLGDAFDAGPSRPNHSGSSRPRTTSRPHSSRPRTSSRPRSKSHGPSWHRGAPVPPRVEVHLMNEQNRLHHVPYPVRAGRPIRVRNTPPPPPPFRASRPNRGRYCPPPFGANGTHYYRASRCRRSSSDDSWADCPMCNSRMRGGTDYCDTCTRTYGC